MTTSIRPRKIKTLGTIAAARSKATDRHVHQFQIACLELERTRRLKELTAAIQRLEELQRRLREIDHEIEQRRQAMAPLPPQAAPTPPAPPPPSLAEQSPAANPAPGKATAPRTRRRTLRY